eukprot:GHRR01030405.1.p1 GENE.GHRR01030405.1~~GHRR01030405.1.p1  ORF type:complete len:374 (+),score=82.52 GHRR01030405.1:524-1645(+)
MGHQWCVGHLYGVQQVLNVSTQSHAASPAGLMLVEPSAGPPDTSPILAGEGTGTLFWYWSANEASGRVNYINKVSFGYYNCYFSDQAGSDVFAPSSEYDYQLAALRQYGTYRLKCTLPNPKNTWTWQPSGNAGMGVAGNLNVSLHFAQEFANSFAVPEPPVYVPSRAGVQHMFQLHAQVDSVTPSTGSLAGGTLLTIKGSGFPSLIDLQAQRATAEVITPGPNGNKACTVVNSTYSTLTCVTAPAASELTFNSVNTVAAGAVFLGSLVPGPRGWIYDVFVNNKTTVSINSATFGQSWTWNTSLMNGTRLTFTDRFQGRNGLTSYHSSRGLGFFIAPVTASYSFSMIGDDIFQLKGLYHNVSASPVLVVLSGRN